MIITDILSQAADDIAWQMSDFQNFTLEAKVLLYCISIYKFSA